MNGFGPIISLNAHIALLTLVDDAKVEVETSKGIIQLAAKSAGRSIVSMLEKSRETMKENKMWVQDIPIGERRYRYTLFGKREEYEISQDDLDFHRRMMLVSLERVLIEEI